MRLAVAAACVLAFVIGVIIIVAAPGLERLPPGGRSIPYIGIVLAWGVGGVGSVAWLRRPDNRTGALMVLVGVMVTITGFQLFDAPVVFVIGAMLDTVVLSGLIHLLLAFPDGRLEGPRCSCATGAPPSRCSAAAWSRSWPTAR